jgi:Xaa-Pro aminopeptidase
MSSPVMNRSRVERVLADAGVDVVVATTYENVYYFSGYEGFVQRVTPATQVYAVLTADALDDPTLVAPLGDLDMQAQFPATLASIRPYGGKMVIETSGGELDEEAARYAPLASMDPADSPATALLDVLGSLPAGARIALDERGLASAVRDVVLAQYGDRIVGGASVLDTIRMVKTDEEIRRLEAAALAIESSYEAAIQAAAEGVSEAELQSVFDRNTIAIGSRPHFTVLAFGERGALPNAVATDWRKLRPGDAIRFDIGCKTEQYSSDIARTAVYGEPSEKLRRYYDAILAGEQAAIDVMRPGVAAKDVFAAAVEATRAAGIPHYRRHHVGHGIGLDTYDAPMLNDTTETPLEPGMVFEVETPYYELGFAGLQVEDTVVITEDGCRVLTQSTRELRAIDTTGGR